MKNKTWYVFVVFVLKTNFWACFAWSGLKSFIIGLPIYVLIFSRPTFISLADFFVSFTTEKIEVLSTGNSIYEDIPDGKSLMHIRYRSRPKREPRAPTFINCGPSVCNFDMRLVPNFFKCFWCIYKHEPPFHYLKVRKFYEWRIKNGKLKSHQIWTQTDLMRLILVDKKVSISQYINFFTNGREVNRFI